MATRKGLLRCINSCNGEVRCMGVRYGSGWYCIVAMVEMDDEFWERWEDLVGGDIDYIQATSYFKTSSEMFTLYAATELSDAIEFAIDAATLKLDGYDDK